MQGTHVGEEPRVVTDKSRRGSRQGAVPKRGNPVCRNLGPQLRHPPGPVNLHRGLDGINWHQQDPKRGRRERGKQGLYADGHRGGRGGRVQEGEGACVCCGVAEAGEGALEEGGDVAAVETDEAAVFVEGTGGFLETGAVAVLVVLKSDRGLVR